MDKSYVLSVIFFSLILLIVISYTINESEKKLLNEIEKLRREVQDDFKSIENDLYTLQSIIDCGKKDELLFKVAQWAISVNGLSTSAVQRHFNVSYIRAKKIVEQLYSLGVIGPTPANLKPCAILIDKDELLNLKRSGKFG